MPTAFSIRITSIIAAQPAALSVAPVAGCDRVEMRADQHDFVFEHRIDARQFRDDVETVRRRFLVKRRLDVELDLDGNSFVEDANHAVVVFDRQRHGRESHAGVRAA